MSKAKSASESTIFNDPIYGFISIPDGIIFDLIQHPWFQRLRRINQLGLTHLVYSGAHHTRFHHAIGAMHLMGQAIDVIRSKGHKITDEEAQGANIAILLHDIGHGPFSHTLEHSIVEGITHEDISAVIMDKLNQEFKGELSLALQIFRNKYKTKFLHQLVASQLDMDRLDYLRRDSFFSGVSEGVINSDRIIKMLNVVNDELTIDSKGIYSIEKFIIARRLMYWQVYLHKTVLSAEFLLMKILQRARELAKNGEELFCTPAFHFFLYHSYRKSDFVKHNNVLETFCTLDDYDILTSIKVWVSHPDHVLATLSQYLISRNLYKIELQSTKIPSQRKEDFKKRVVAKHKLNQKESDYFVFSGEITNSAYNPASDKINILFKDGKLQDIAEAADLLNISVLSKAVKKYYLCYPKD